MVANNYNLKNVTIDFVNSMSGEEVKSWLLNCLQTKLSVSKKDNTPFDFGQFASNEKLRPNINYVYEQIGQFKVATDMFALAYEFVGDNVEDALKDLRDSNTPLCLYDKKNKLVYKGTLNELNKHKDKEEFITFKEQFPDAPNCLNSFPNFFPIINDKDYDNSFIIDINEYKIELAELEKLHKKTKQEEKEYKKRMKANALRDNERNIVFSNVLEDAVFSIGNQHFKYDIVKKLVYTCEKWNVNTIHIKSNSFCGALVKTYDKRKFALFMPYNADVQYAEKFSEHCVILQ